MYWLFEAAGFRELRESTDVHPEVEQAIESALSGCSNNPPGLSLDFPDRTEFPEHEALWDGANYKTAY